MQKLETKLNFEDIFGEVEISSLLSEGDLVKIGHAVVADFDSDLKSRESWEKRIEASLKLALQVAEAKNFPWPNASNVKFPLITIAALQYHARSYPVLIDGDRPVKCRVVTEDKDGQRALRADRVERHMSFQILEEDEDWESEMDKVLITQPIVGCAFKKTYFDPIKNHNISENVLAKDFVVNYWTKSLETAPRMTHVLQMSKNEIYERVALGLWNERCKPEDHTTATNPQAAPSTLHALMDKTQGTQAPEVSDASTPTEMLESHCFFDLDDDGYEEPYVVVVNRHTKKVARVAPRYSMEDIKFSEKEGEEDLVISIKAEQYFTKYPFIPSPDGGFYDLGFGLLLGPLNESINTIINQLVDAGTMATTAGGFLSRGIKLRGGATGFNPLEWKHVDTTGDDLRKGIVPLPVREPSQVLFTMLNLLINYGERIGGSVDVLVGQNPGQNTPAETTRTMAEQGMKIFNGIFKRTYRSLKNEFRKLYRLNQIHVSSDYRYITDSEGSIGLVMVEDYKGPSTDVMPSADPSITSDQHRLMQARMVAERSAAMPGLYNKYEAEKIFLKAIKVPDVEKVLPDPKGPNAIPQQPHPKIQIEQMKIQAAKASDELNLKIALLKLMSEAELNQAKVQKLEAEAEAIKIGVITDAGNLRIQEINTQIAAARAHREGVLNSVKAINDVFETMIKGHQALSQDEGGSSASSQEVLGDAMKAIHGGPPMPQQ